ncbi:BRO family protein [Thaumasiovibrio subtropicus]|uniref:BRO family protein n=1 Tax=Thaumasiovibrio subtropicus TaxID=1891207 RepID=UPI000B34C336|nr:BRO family protein [Thaumasiovibrio subtropicus]
MNLSETIFSYNSAASGKVSIRTIEEQGVLFFSLHDVVQTISAENQVLEPTSRPSGSMLSLMRGHATHLLQDEIRVRDNVPDNILDPLFESYVTQAGLLRVVLQGNSPACIKFQKWVLEDVIPSVLERGAYTYPSTNQTGTSLSLEGEFDVETMLVLQLQETRERKAADAALKKQMNTIAQDIGELRKQIEQVEYLLVADHWYGENLSKPDQYLLFAHCLNLSSDGSGSYKSQKRSSGRDICSKAFTIETIDKAVLLFESSKRNNEVQQ